LIDPFHILPLPAVRFDRLTVLSLPKEERVGVRRREKYLNIHLE